MTTGRRGTQAAASVTCRRRVEHARSCRADGSSSAGCGGAAAPATSRARCSRRSIAMSRAISSTRCRTRRSTCGPSTDSSSELHDPHSAYLSPALLARLRSDVGAVRRRRRADRRARRMDRDRRADARRPRGRRGNSDRRSHRRRSRASRCAADGRGGAEGVARRARHGGSCNDRAAGNRDATRVRADAARDPSAFRAARADRARQRRLRRAHDLQRGIRRRSSPSDRFAAGGRHEHL